MSGQQHEGSVTDPPAPIAVQDQFSFIAGVQAGPSSLFSIVNTQSELKTKKVLVHDLSRVHFSNDKSLADVEVEDTKDFELEVRLNRRDKRVSQRSLVQAFRLQDIHGSK